MTHNEFRKWIETRIIEAREDKRYKSGNERLVYVLNSALEGDFDGWDEAIRLAFEEGIVTWENGTALLSERRPA